MSREHGSGESRIEEPRPSAEVVDFAQAKAKRAEKSTPLKIEKGPDFETEKREFLERTRESLNAVRKRTSTQRSEMQARQDALDRRRMLLGGLTREGKSIQETSYATGNQNIDTAFATMERNLELAEQIDYPELFAEVRQSFEESLRIMEQELDEQEKVLGRVPQKQLDAMPEIVRREVLQQQQIAETFPDDLLGKLDSYRQRLNLISGLVNPDAIKKVANAISDMEGLVSGLKLISGLKRLDSRSSLEATMSKIDQAIRNGEEQSRHGR
ncbi:MAG: hypothetical protein Q8P83_00865 [bacterium]|nr:hypothetical protein [bacterium]